MDNHVDSAAYGQLVNDVEVIWTTGRQRALASVAQHRFLTYHAIGSTILQRQQEQGWGSQVIARLAADLKVAFPDQRGLSVRNLQYMCTMARAWPDPNCAAAAAQLPWGHVMVLLDRLDDAATRDWYATQALEAGWSRGVLEDRIAGHLHQRVGAAPSNYATHLPAPDSDLAQRATRDPVVLDFLGLTGIVREKNLEDAMMDNLARTMLELGNGLAFVGRQLPLRVGGQEFFADLVFFQYTTNRFIVFELKVGTFDPRDAGQLGFYVQAVDQQLRQPETHAQTIGILLCTSRDDQVVEYSLATTAAPVAVATYTYDQLPADIRGALPPADSIARAVEPPPTTESRPEQS